jgi:hypothetical protein
VGVSEGPGGIEPVSRADGDVPFGVTFDRGLGRKRLEVRGAIELRKAGTEGDEQTGRTNHEEGEQPKG